jgi:hypothetical protein
MQSETTTITDCNHRSSMCYFCHTLKNNPSAPQHKSINCIDKRNSHSQYKDAKVSKQCRYCHEQKKNPNAPAHNSIDCRDKKSPYTKHNPKNAGKHVEWCSLCKEQTIRYLRKNNPLEDAQRSVCITCGDQYSFPK